jgi:hypothetical protein
MVRAMKLLSALTLAFVLLAGCQKADAPSTIPDNTGGGDPVVTDPYACAADDECVAVELECCDACNGGEAVGVHRDHVDEVAGESPRGQGACDGVACTKMACAPFVAACEAGKCTIARGTF